MKRHLLVVFALVISTCAFSQGFDKSKLRAGVGFLYATEISNVGFKLDGTYSFTEEWEGDLTFSHIFKKDYTTFNALDLDAHYYFAELNDNCKIYGLAGLDMTFVKTKIPSTTVSSSAYGYSYSYTSSAVEASSSNVGFNLGIGANYAINDKINLLPEVRYTLVDGSYLRIGVSAQYSF